MKIATVCFVIAGAAVSSCATPPPVDPGHNRPLSVAEHETEAKRHERVAAEQQALYDPESNVPGAAPIQCFDRPLAGVPTDGAEPIRVLRPCWSADTNPTADHRRAAMMNLKAAREHRAHAANLLRTERQACAGLGEQEIGHGPFFHRGDILSVERYLEGKNLRGAVVTFRKVPGLSATWFTRAAECQLARAAVMGYATTFHRYSPLALRDVATAVEDKGDTIQVIVRSTDSITAAAVLGRARDLHGGE